LSALRFDDSYNPADAPAVLLDGTPFGGAGEPSRRRRCALPV
jgi:hypothetical protein